MSIPKVQNVCHFVRFTSRTTAGCATLRSHPHQKNTPFEDIVINSGATRVFHRVCRISCFICFENEACVTQMFSCQQLPAKAQCSFTCLYIRTWDRAMCVCFVHLLNFAIGNIFSPSLSLCCLMSNPIILGARIMRSPEYQYFIIHVPFVYSTVWTFTILPFVP